MKVMAIVVALVLLAQSAMANSWWFLIGVIVTSGHESAREPSPMRQKLLIGTHPESREPKKVLPSWVIDPEQTWVVDGRCLTHAEATWYAKEAEGNRHLILRYLAESGIPVEDHTVVRSVLRNGWWCWYIDARITPLANTSD